VVAFTIRIGGCLVILADFDSKFSFHGYCALLIILGLG
jgi:hypothetical protein